MHDVFPNYMPVFAAFHNSLIVTNSRLVLSVKSRSFIAPRRILIIPLGLLLFPIKVYQLTLGLLFRRAVLILNRFNACRV